MGEETVEVYAMQPLTFGMLKGTYESLEKQGMFVPFLIAKQT